MMMMMMMTTTTHESQAVLGHESQDVIGHESKDILEKGLLGDKDKQDDEPKDELQENLFHIESETSDLKENSCIIDAKKADIKSNKDFDLTVAKDKTKGEDTDLVFNDSSQTNWNAESQSLIKRRGKSSKQIVKPSTEVKDNDRNIYSQETDKKSEDNPEISEESMKIITIVSSEELEPPSPPRSPTPDIEQVLQVNTYFLFFIIIQFELSKVIIEYKFLFHIFIYYLTFKLICAEI